MKTHNVFQARNALFHQTMIFYLMYDSRHDLTPL